LTPLEESRIPDIIDVKIKHDGKCLMVQFGNHTHYYDKRDLFNLSNWNDRKDNREATLKKLQEKKND
jgi:hypothetical protein